MKKQIIKNQLKERRRKRVRAKIQGTAKVPRLNIFRSLRYVSVQLIDDSKGQTLVFVSDKDSKSKGTKVDSAKEVGKKIAKLAQEKGINKVVFDRAAYKYHGRVKAVAEGAREAGLEF